MNLAFSICQSLPAKQKQYSDAHMNKLAQRYKKKILQLEFGQWSIILVGSCKYQKNETSLRFSLCIDEVDPTLDRYLLVELTKDKILVTNDYAGSIPFFYSNKNGFCASNIEPYVVKGSGATQYDLCPERLFGYLRYGHFIWTETAWKHVDTLPPDATAKFDHKGKCIKQDYNASVFASDENVGLSDTQVASKLYELNNNLVTRALEGFDEIILPLSSGYDSRMILAVIAENQKLREKTRCFTYGAIGSVEVESARRLSRAAGVEWSFVDLPCKFLNHDRLAETADVFGCSLHMHGMYQLEFFDEIRKRINLSSKAVLTSGFMTGVPAGQHNGLLGIAPDTRSLSNAMDKFPQSKFWPPEHLVQLAVFKDTDYSKSADTRFHAAFDRFEGEYYQKAVMFDIWTRQRNFISYYPRTFEWVIPTISPQMTPAYANFFLSLSAKHLQDRKAVELMFDRHYPEFARIVSNSNGLRSISSRSEDLRYLVSRVLHKLKLGRLMPEKYSMNRIDFDIAAVRNIGKEAFLPAFDDHTDKELIGMFGGREMFDELYAATESGDAVAYNRFTRLQSLFLCLEWSAEENMIG